MFIQLSFIPDSGIIPSTSFPVNGRFDLGDERFGSTRTGSKCVICKKSETGGCYGHHGHLSLGTKIFHPMFLFEIARALNSICHHCGASTKLSTKKKTSGKRGGKCVECRGTIFIDYYIPPSQPTVARRRNAPSIIVTPEKAKFVLDKYKAKEAEYIIGYISVPPTGIRPVDDAEWPTELSRLYIRLIDTVKSSTRSEAYQRIVSNLYNSIVGYLKKDGVIAALSGKQGIFRSLMLGKRLNRSIRLVITGDPNLDIDEILVSRSIAERVRVPEKVWNGNFLRMKQLARDGKLWYPSEEVQVDESDVLVGKEYDRALGNGDIVTFNRQPSLTKMSLLAMKLKLSEKDTNVFAFNPCITTTFNADFDGDEMNVYGGYGLEAAAELRTFCYITENIRDPLNGKIFIKPIQDVVSGIYMMTKENVPVPRNLFYDCCMLISKQPLHGFNTHTLFSTVLPDTMNLVVDKMEIQNGQLVRGTINDKMIYRIMSYILDYHGTSECAKFLKEIQLLALRWMRDKAFSMSLGDCLWDQDDIETYKKMVEGIETDREISMVQSWVLETSMSKYVSEKSNNPLAIMYHSGAKGKEMGPSQMAVSVGQQYIGDEKVRSRMNQYSPHDNGFISSSYTHGLDPKEYFSQAVTSLNGIIDIGVGVSAIGYTNRRVSKLMAGVEMGYNGVVSTGDQVVRFQ